MTQAFRAAAVIPVRDGLPDLLDAVASALDQSLPPAEVIVVDDGSSDGSGDAVHQRFGDRVRVVPGRFGSAAAARNAGWRASTADWIAFLDADDLWFPEKLATAAACLEQCSDARWFFSDGRFRTLEGELHESWLSTYADLHDPYAGHPTAELVEVNFILTSSVVVGREALAGTGGFDQGMSHAEDVDLWIKLSRRHLVTASSRALVRYQHRPGGLTRQIEPRLLGDVSLFERLAQDPELPAAVRSRARVRVSVARTKLAVAMLRDGKRREARQHLAAAWRIGERRRTVASLWAASLLPMSLLARMRGQRWATARVGAPINRLRRVTLGAPAAAGPRRRP